MRRELLSLAVVVCVAACGRDSTPRIDTGAATPPPASSGATANVDTAPVSQRDSAARPSPTARGSGAGAPSSATSAQVSERGVGPVKIGMTLAEARAATNGAVVAPRAAETSECGFARWPGGPDGLRMMTASGRIVRIDVGSGTTPTSAGARIGDSEARIAQLYSGRVETTPAKYTKGHTLTITPATPADSAYRIVFETDGRLVTRYRAGRLPEIGYVEGCG